jgi:hypothetical protein
MSVIALDHTIARLVYDIFMPKASLCLRQLGLYEVAGGTEPLTELAVKLPVVRKIIAACSLFQVM